MDDLLKLQLQLRLDGELHRKLVAAARAANRSLNSELNHRLQTSFDAATSPGEIEALRELARERGQRLEALSRLDGVLAGIVLRLLERLSPEQREQPEVRVWSAVADGVVTIDPLTIAERLAEMSASGPETTKSTPPGRK